MWNPFIWLSGADTQIIDNCPNTKRYEKIKSSGIGSLVLAPAVVGFFSMTYAISTVATDYRIYFAGGIVWALIVLAIDRLLVSTTNKTTVKIGNSNYAWLAVTARYVFAVFLGIAVSHPLVLLWFNESITQRIEKNKREEISQRRGSADTEKQNLSRGFFSSQLETKNALKDCLVKLKTAEQSGVQEKLECGYSSGLPECGTRCIEIDKEIVKTTSEIEELTKKAQIEINQRNTDIGNIDTVTNNDVQKIDSQYSKDYLARVDALAQLENGSVLKGEEPKPHIWRVGLFIMLLLVLVDILPITLKLAIPMGEYEIIRDTMLIETQARKEAEREAIKDHAQTVHRSTTQAKLNVNSTKDEISSITEMTRQFISQQEKERDDFSKRLNIIRKKVSKIKDNQLRIQYAQYVTSASNMFSTALSKAMTKFQKFLERL